MIVGIVLLLSARGARADRPELDARRVVTLGIGMGDLEIGDTGGLIDPDVHASFALVTAPFEVMIVGDWAPWLGGRGDKIDDVDVGGPRRMLRIGTALRWDVFVGEHDNPDVTSMAFVDAGMGWQHLYGALGSADRGDLAIGGGMEQLFLWDGHARLGIDISLRGFAAPATDGTARLTCQGWCSARSALIDLGLVFDLGLVVRR